MRETRSPRGLAGVTVGETAISSLLAEGPQYRGYRFQDLADQLSFEEVTCLLLDGELPKRAELAAYRRALHEEATLPAPLLAMLRHLPAGAQANEVFRLGISYLACDDEELDDQSPKAHRRKACRLIARAPLIVTAWYRLRAGLAPLAPRPDWSYAGNLLWLMGGLPPAELPARALNQLLIVYAENEFNASTFAARVASSTQADLYAAVTAALATHKGAWHGGAVERVMHMLREIGSPSHAVAWLRDALARRQKVMGFGHRVFTAGDPRARYLKPVCQELAGAAHDISWETLADTVESFLSREKQLYPNVDWPTARLFHYLGVPLELYTPLFAVSRIAGWCAHAMEQMQDQRLIRPLAAYAGPPCRAIIPLDARG